jgi:hypothetical protein
MRPAAGLHRPSLASQALRRLAGPLHVYAGDCFGGKLPLACFRTRHPDARARRRWRQGSRRGGGRGSLLRHPRLAQALHQPVPIFEIARIGALIDILSPPRLPRRHRPSWAVKPTLRFRCFGRRSYAELQTFMQRRKRSTPRRWRSERRLALRAREAHGVKPLLSLYPMPPIFINRRHGFSLG